MNYSISSNRFQHPLLKPILEKLVAYFAEEDIRFYIIGATARDIIMNIHGEKARRATRDLDLAIAVSDWDQYEAIERGIISIEGFKKDYGQKQRFIYLDAYKIDIIPFGEIMKEDDKIFWPPDESIAMTVLGFSDVQSATKQVTIDDDMVINVASLDGLFILKLIAWIDRCQFHNKDADDIAFILNNYLSINEKNAVDNYYEEIYLNENFSTNSGGPFLLGVDMGKILSNSPSSIRFIVEKLEHEIKAKEESRLANQIMETNPYFTFEETILCLQNIINGLNYSV